ncbi:MAG: hypothetical protein SCJ94_00290 [Bacillota bacterium]|nr:hypothetical protein [Bacillota bacterium]MDW7728433.1 hypothetical protein [Bacillota bacterium]
MKVIIGIDDTDNHTTEMGTGRLLTKIVSEIEANSGIAFSGVVRHQLFVHPSIPYTSHNSAMSVTTEVDTKRSEMLLKLFPKLLVQYRANGSDPGFCLANADILSDQQKEALVGFGRRAKVEVLSKSSAYDLAASLNIRLSEHGGTGHGVIGALAGVGLRLSGSDGRFRGKYELGKPGETTSVKVLLNSTAIDSVEDLSGMILSDDTVIKLGEKVKGVLINNRKVLLVVPNHDINKQASWQTCPMEYLRRHH